MFNFALSNLITNFSYYKKYIFYIFIIVCLISTHFICYFHGKNVANEENEAKYRQELITKLEEQEAKSKEQINKIKDSLSQEQKIKIIYKDRVKTVKEIVKADNFKCEMTDDQIKSLNSFKNI